MRRDGFALRATPLRVTSSSPSGMAMGKRVHFDSGVAGRRIRGVLSAGNASAVAVKSASGPLRCDFVVDGVREGRRSCSLGVATSKRPIKVSEGRDRSVAVPTGSDFHFLSTRHVDRPRGKVRVIFSSPISSARSLGNLVRVPRVPSCVFRVASGGMGICFRTNRLDGLALGVRRKIGGGRNGTLNNSRSVSFNRLGLGPRIRVSSTNTVVPSSGGLMVPFQTIDLCTMSLQIVHVFRGGILVFVRGGSLSSTGRLEQSKELICGGALFLNGSPSGSLRG